LYLNLLNIAKELENETNASTYTDYETNAPTYTDHETNASTYTDNETNASTYTDYAICAFKFSVNIQSFSATLRTWVGVIAMRQLT